MVNWVDKLKNRRKAKKEANWRADFVNFYLNRAEKDKESAVNIVDKETDGEVSGQPGVIEDFTREHPAGDLPSEQSTFPEYSQYKMPRQAEKESDRLSPHAAPRCQMCGIVNDPTATVCRGCGSTVTPTRRPIEQPIQRAVEPVGQGRTLELTGDEPTLELMAKKAETGQELTQLTTERETGKTRQKDTTHGMTPDSYRDDNKFEDADLKLGEVQDEEDDTLTDAVNAPYSQGTGPLDSRYEDANKNKHNIILHASDEIDPNKGPDYIWVAVDLDGTILEPPPNNEYQDENGYPVLGDPIDGAQEALQELMDGGARVSIYTARAYFIENGGDEENLIEAIENKLSAEGIPFSDIYIGNKPPAHYFIDDRNIPFKGDWDLVLDAVRDKLHKNAQTDTLSAERLVRLYELEYKIDQLNRRKEQTGGWSEDTIQNKLWKWEDELKSVLRVAIDTMYSVYEKWIEHHATLDMVPGDYVNNEVEAIIAKEYPEYKEDTHDYEMLYDELYNEVYERVAEEIWSGTSEHFGNMPHANIADMRDELEKGASGDVGQDMVLFQKALTIAHNNGSMAEHLAHMTDITVDLLNQLTEGKFIPQWDAELKKIAQTDDDPEFKINEEGHKVRVKCPCGNKEFEFQHASEIGHGNTVECTSCGKKWLYDLTLAKLANDPVKDIADYHGIKIDVEWPKGSIRSYAGSDTYVTHMKCHYGYARGVDGNDGEELDIYLGDGDSDIAYIIEQVKEDGSYDEDKIMLGFDSEGEAIDMYLAHMPAYMLGDVREVPVDKLCNALYGEPEDRRGQEDQTPSEESDKDSQKVFEPKIEKKTKSDYVGPQSSQSGGIGGPAADSDVESSVWPTTDLDENEWTDPDETRENRDIGRTPETERARYRNP
jgi:hypothetical protein